MIEVNDLKTMSVSERTSESDSGREGRTICKGRQGGFVGAAARLLEVFMLEAVETVSSPRAVRDDGFIVKREQAMYERLGDERRTIPGQYGGKWRWGEVGKHVWVCMKRDVPFRRGSTASFIVS